MKSEFEQWCDKYGIFHFLNLDEEKVKTYRLLSTERITTAFLEEKLPEMVSRGEILYFYVQENGEYCVFVGGN